MDKSRATRKKRSRRSKQCTSPLLDPDPVIDQEVKDEESLLRAQPKAKKQESSVLTLKPSLNTRIDLTTHSGGIEPGIKYVVPKSRKIRREYEERRRKYVEDLNFCKYKEIKVPMPIKGKMTMMGRFQQPSAEIKEAKVFPRKPSVTPSDTYPEPPNRKDLSLREPKSGTIINIHEELHIKKKRRRRRKPPPAEYMPALSIEELMAQELAVIEEMAEGGEAYAPPPENYLTRQFRRKVSQLSKSTSIKSKDYTGGGEEEEEEGAEKPQEDRFINVLIQKFRRDSEIHRHEKPKRKIKSGTFENFSFTKLRQPTLKTFYYGVKLGTIDQNDKHFPAVSRNRQGICMPIAAFCMSILKHPDRWTQADIDNVLEAGNELFLDSAKSQHLHGDEVDLKITDLQKYCKVGRKKIRFVVSEPEVSGLIRTDDNKVYNLTKGINIFFKKYTAGILKTETLSVAIWKDKHFYFFDAGPRTIDLFTHPNGVALMANFYDSTAVVTVLLNRSNLESQPFNIYSIQAYRVLARDAEEVDSSGVIPEMDNFQVLSEEKAVALGSFDLADKCFGFSRNKQALTISTIALVYSKITPPSSWHKGTVDKIIIIGNQLFLECIENDSVEEVTVEDLPAVFTIGPYVVEIYIVANCFVDFMFKKSKCMLQERLQKFFETNSNAIVQINLSILAVWKQRNIYHCFDPYSRNNEGLKCREGSACVSMHTTLESLINTIAFNFDHKDMIFHIHAMKVCKIHRDPATTDLFPKCLTMNEYPVENFKKIKMKKGKRKATAKFVTVDYDTRATMYDQLPSGSIFEVGSTVRSISPEDISGLPAYEHKIPLKDIPKPTPLDEEYVADLDSPSLSDTQIEPPAPEQPDGETLIDFVDLDSFQLTQEEKEMEKRGEGKEGEGEDRGKKGGGEDAGEGGEGEDDGTDRWYMAASQYTQIGSQSLLSRMSQEVNTDFFHVEIPEEVPVLPRNIKAIQRLQKDSMAAPPLDITLEPTATLSEELAKETNFVNLPDGSQLIRGGINMAAFGQELEFMSPFVCIMACTVAKKYSIDSWSKDVVDYVLKCGAELHNCSNTRYDQNYKLEIPKISLGQTDFSIRVNYIFDTFLKPKVLAMALTNMLFGKWPAGILVTPTYSCALFYKNHLYYLFDGFGNNEVGLSKGSSNEGVACLARFLDIHSLVDRLMHNKAKREEDENVEYNRFVLSSCYVKKLRKESVEETSIKEELGEEGGEGVDDVVIQTYKKPKEQPKPKPPKMGYHLVDGGLFKIEGTKSIGGEKECADVLKEDYFVCVCACLMLLNNPIKTWDDRKINAVVDQGMHIFSHMEDLEVCSRKFIQNIVIDDYVFDISLKRVNFPFYESRKSLRAGIETMLTKKHEHFILQFPNRSYTLSVIDSIYHLFDPSDNGKTTWTRYNSFHRLVNRIRKGLVKGGESYNFHCFEVMGITKAPKPVIISNRTKKYKQRKAKKLELEGKPFYEELSWLEVDPIPWSWRVNKRDLPFWKNWYVDICEDLYSLFGSLQPAANHIGNLVVALGLVQIYDLEDWNVSIMDSIVLHGEEFFKECIQNISDENYEVSFEDLNKECTIFPYSFRVQFKPIVEGTLFLVRLKQFNLYKALRLFFDDYERRYGVICVTKGENGKRLFSFGKVQEGEYFLYDCETLGPPMFVEKDSGVPYMLRTTTLNRLLHVMTLTIRGGDFFIFEVGLSELKSIM